MSRARPFPAPPSAALARALECLDRMTSEPRQIAVTCSHFGAALWPGCRRPARPAAMMLERLKAAGWADRDNPYFGAHHDSPRYRITPTGHEVAAGLAGGAPQCPMTRV